MRLVWRASTRSRDLGKLNGAYLVKRGCLGSLGLDSGRGGGLSRSEVEGCNHCRILCEGSASLPCGCSPRHGA